MSYKWKLLINFTLLFTAFTLLLVLFQYNREKLYKRELIESQLRSYADIVAGSVEIEHEKADTTCFDCVTTVLPAELRLTVISRSGRVLYESNGREIREMANHLNRPEVRLAMERHEGSNIRLSETDNREYFYFAKNFGTYTVRVALPFDAGVKNFLKADNVFLWFVLMLFPIAMVVLIYISDRFGKAVGSLRNFMHSADRGLIDYDHIEFPHSELGDLGRDIMQKYKLLEESSEKINAERERLLRHFHYFDEGIGIFTPERESIYVNPRFMQYVNVVLEHPTANIAALWDSESFAPVVDFLYLNSNRRSATEQAPIFRYTLHSGSSTFSVQVLIYNDGTFEITLADVTRTEKAQKLKQQMSNNITHELRTPVSSIRGYIETIQNCPSLSEEKKMYFLEKAHAQVIRLTDLIRDVALITKTEEAAELMPREEVNIAHIVEEVKEELHDTLSRAGMKVNCSLPSETVVRGNYSLIYSIFRNLMENAARYAGQGAEFNISCYNTTPDFLYFSAYDTGCGVPEEHLPRLFERFYRITEGRTRETGGTGLGLSIVRNAVLFHSGDISVRNRKGAGLEFLFTLHR